MTPEAIAALRHTTAAMQLRAIVLTMGMNPEETCCGTCGKKLCDCPDSAWNRRITVAP